MTSPQSFTLQPPTSSTLSYSLVVAGSLAVLGNTLTIGSGGSLEWRKASPLNLTALTINNGGVLSHSYNSTSQLYQVNVVANNVTINQGGMITADGKGYSKENGPGGGDGGAAYGGNTYSHQAYGSVKTPVDLGSGGLGSAGGGLIQVLVNGGGTLSLSGTITAKGSGASNGAGSGGTILLDTDTLSGVNTLASVNANGGASSGGNTESGSGGRVAIKYNTDGYTGSISNLINVTNAQGGASNTHGSAGTIFYFDKNTDTNGHLVIKNPGHNYPNESTTTPLPHSELFDSMIVDRGSVVEVKVGDTFTLPSSTVNYYLVMGGDALLPASSPTTLTVNSPGVLEFRRGTPVTHFPNVVINAGARMTHSYNSSTKTYWIDLETTTFQLSGTIDVSGRGYVSDYGPGYGAATQSSSGSGTFISGGGAHGGLGHMGDVERASGVYGSIKLPNDLGSGGAYTKRDSNYYYGGAGGGLVILKASNSITLTGDISANGVAGNSLSTSKAGGGAGGGIRIVTNNLAGNGSKFYARGGDGPGGNGGGGRVAITVNLGGGDTYAAGAGVPTGIPVDVRGGTSSSYSGAGGTYFYKHSADTYGHLIIDNKAMPYTLGVETELIQTEGFDSITVATSTTGVSIRKGTTITFSSSNLDYPLVMAGMAIFPSNNLTIQNTGQFYFATDALLTLNNLTLETGSLMSHLFNGSRQQYVVNIEASNMTMKNNSLINANGLGYGAQQGPGRGQSGGSIAGGGASHGGIGGGSVSGVSSPGSTYGDANLPITIGSGGGGGSSASCEGGAGGGAIHLKITNTFILDGQIKANGASTTAPSCFSGGGGSGGSVFIEANAITTEGGSTGLIQAKGGGAPIGATHGGGGGGGRVNINSTSNIYTSGSNASVDGGTANPDRTGVAGSLVTTP